MGEELKSQGYYCYKKSSFKPEDRYLVFISRQPTFPNVQGNRVYINELLSWFKGEGYKILYLYPCLDFKESLPAMADSVDDLYVVNPAFKRPSEFKKLSKIDHSVPSARYVLELVLENYPVEAVLANYAHMASYLRSVPDTVKKLVLTHDALYKLAFLPFKIAENRICTYEEEKELLSFADVILGINDTESLIFKEMFQGEKAVITVGMPASRKNLQTSKIDSFEKQTVFCAASGNPMNVGGVKDFIERCWPKIQSECPQAQLKIAGTVCESLESFKKAKGVTFLGVLEDLGREMQKASFVLNATKEGTGLKIKTIDALAYGKAIVTFPSGVDGMKKVEKSGSVVCFSERELTTRIIFLLKNPEEIKKLEEKSSFYAFHYLSKEHVYEELKKVLIKKNSPESQPESAFWKAWKKKLKSFFQLQN